MSEMHKYAIKNKIKEEELERIVIKKSEYETYINKHGKEYFNILQDTKIFIQELKKLKPDTKIHSIIYEIDYKNEIYSLIVQNNITGSIKNYENVFDYIREEKLEDILNVDNIANAIFINKHLNYFKYIK